MSTRVRGTLPMLMVLAGWLVAAVAVGASGRLTEITPPGPQLLIIVITVVFILTLTLVRPLLRFVFTVDIRVLVGLHVTRLVGIYLLVLEARGDLPAVFAVRAGWGDIIVAVLAVGVIALGPPTSRPRWLAYFGWNVIGLVDMLLVVATVLRLAVAEPNALDTMLRLPMSVLPTFLVPIIIASHIMVFVRLHDESATSVSQVDDAGASMTPGADVPAEEASDESSV